MKKLYDLCKQYGIEITMTYDAYYAYSDSVLFKFYDRKTNKYFCQIVTDEMMNATNVSFEDHLCERVIKELKLDKDLWARTEPDYILRTCERCNGRGKITEMDALIPYNFHNSICPECNGEGKIKIGYC